NALHIYAGRHPLLELCTDNFVGCSRNKATAQSNNEERTINSIGLITGANSSGKSAIIQQTALITIMAQCGSFVSADSAVIGVCDKVLTRMHQKESLSCKQSSFMTELMQLKRSIKYSTQRTLLLLDEVGSGTDTNDGAGLFAASIKYFLRRGLSCPKVLAASHFNGEETYYFKPD
ncbi:P-loop containing nucleoside triphosphate hydrolase protein, partial [Violaceomyces palustris]